MDLTRCKPIFVGPHWDVLFQTKNCEAMLRYVRPERGLRLIWVDAICINQRNVQERGEQVAQMKNIYSNCLRVFLWLGEDVVQRVSGRHPNHQRLETLHDGEHKQPGTSVNSKQSHESFGLVQLFGRRYFKRMWVIQELILAPRVVIPIGNTFYWIDRHTGAWFAQSIKQLQAVLPWVESISRGSMVGADSYYELAALTYGSTASDPRDRLFAVLGLLKTTSTSPDDSRKSFLGQISADYSLSTRHFTVGFFAHCLLIERVTSLLHQAAGTRCQSGYPTWTPGWNTWETFRYSDLEPRRENELFLLENCRETLQVDGLAYCCISFDPVLRSQLPHTPWFSIGVEAKSGTISLCLVRIQVIKYLERRLVQWRHYFYRVSCNDSTLKEGIAFCTQQNDEGNIVQSLDELYAIVPGYPREKFECLIFLILRPVKDKNLSFQLVATANAIDAYSSNQSKLDRSNLPLFHIYSTVYSVIEDLHFFFHGFRGTNEQDLSFSNVMAEGLFLFRDITWKELLPLWLAVIRETYGMEQYATRNLHDVILALRPPGCQAWVGHGYIEVGLEDVQYAKSMPKRQSGWLPISDIPSLIERHRLGSFRYPISAIKAVVQSYIETKGAGHQLEKMYTAGHLGWSDGEVAARLRAGPKEDDRLHVSPCRNPFVEQLGLDGRVLQVRIV